MKKRLEKIKQMNQEMQRFEEDKNFLDTIFVRLQNIHERQKMLQKYYEEEWISDHEKFPNEQIGILSEDGLWNLFHEIYEKEKEILKFLVNKL